MLIYSPNMLIYIVVLLDPLYKEHYVQFVLEPRYGASESLEKMTIVKEVASLLFNDYKYGMSSSEQSSEMAQIFKQYCQCSPLLNY